MLTDEIKTFARLKYLYHSFVQPGVPNIMKLINGEVEGLKHVQKITDSFIKYPRERTKRRSSTSCLNP